MRHTIKPVFVGIAGGTGAGKSTLCTALMDKYPEQIGLIQLDDYFRPSEEVPRLAGLENWDHPDSLYLERLVNDLAKLKRGRSVTIRTKNERLNPDYVRTDKRIPVVFHPKPVMLVEGLLVLHDEHVRDLLTTSIWLEVDHDTRWRRRVHFKFSEYEQKVLIPMYEQFAKPSKQYASYVVDVADQSRESVLASVEQLLDQHLTV